MTSGSTFPNRLTKIDDLARPDHFYLAATDECYFIGEYTARKLEATQLRRTGDLTDRVNDSIELVR